MMRRLATILAASLLAGLGASAAQAETTESARCDAMLIEIADKQHVVEELKAAVAKGQADRDAMNERASELAARIAELKAEGKDASKLVQARADVLDEIAALENMGAVVKAQLDSLTAELEASEKAYVDCVDGSIAG